MSEAKPKSSRSKKATKKSKDAAEPKKRKKKDPSAPKRAMTAYLFFSIEQRPIVKKDNPDIAFGDIAKEISAKWKDLDAHDKKKYDKLAEADKKRYEKEKDNYQPPDDDDDGGAKKKESQKSE